MYIFACGRLIQNIPAKRHYLRFQQSGGSFIKNWQKIRGGNLIHKSRKKRGGFGRY